MSEKGEGDRSATAEVFCENIRRLKRENEAFTVDRERILGVDFSEDVDRTAIAVFGKSKTPLMGSHRHMEMPGYAVEQVWSGKTVKAPPGGLSQVEMDIQRTLDYFERSIYQALRIPATYLIAGPAAFDSLRKSIESVEGTKVVSMEQHGCSIDVELCINPSPATWEDKMAISDGPVEGHKREENNRPRVDVEGLVPLRPETDSLSPGEKVVFVAGQHIGEVYDVAGYEMNLEDGTMEMRVSLVGLASMVRCNVLARYTGDVVLSSTEPVGRVVKNRTYAPNEWHCYEAVNGPQIMWVNDDKMHSMDQWTLEGLMYEIKRCERGDDSGSFQHFLDGAKTLVRYMLKGNGVPFPAKCEDIGVAYKAMAAHLVSMVMFEDDGADLNLILDLDQLLEGDVVATWVVRDGRIVSVANKSVVVMVNDGNDSVQKNVITSSGDVIEDPFDVMFCSRPGRRACPNPSFPGVYNWGEMAKLRWKGFFYQADYYNGDRKYFSELDQEFVSGVERDIENKLKVEDGIDEAFVVPYEPPAPVVAHEAWDPYGLAGVSRPCPEWPEGAHPARRIFERKEVKK
jgi:hypothetical protein